jgi:hypothetical protein
MMKIVFVSTFISLSSISPERAAALEGDIEVANSKFQIILNNSQKTITIKHKKAVHQIINLEASSIHERKIRIADFNFDGAEDISVSGDEGNVERFSTVYLFSKKSGKFELNRQFSAIPCIAVDTAKKIISGECFHASACENWVEKYSVGKRNELTIKEKNGFFCEPTTDRFYKYVENYRNGKLVKNKITEIKP